MANRRQPLIPGWCWTGLLASGLILTIATMAIAALWHHAPESNWQTLWKDSYLWHVVRFTFWQALLSALISVLPAILLARALYRRHFPGREWLLRLCTMTFVMPVLVAVFGLISVYGQQGWLAILCRWLGITYSFSPYGLQGILLGHLFFNLPLATRMLLHALENIPVEQRKLAAQLGMTNWYQWCILEWPVLRQQLLPISALIFMLCFASFVPALELGGGPQASTLELAIYQALSYDYDLRLAAVLAMIQLVCCLGLLLLSQKLSHTLPIGNSHAHLWHNLAESKWYRLSDGLLITAALLFLLPPILAVITNGINQPLSCSLQQPQLWLSLITSVRIALSAGLLCVVLTMMLLWSSRELKLRKRWHWSQILELSGMVILAMPSIVLATGFFLLLSNTRGVPQSPYALVITSNALMAIPYALKILEKPMFDLADRYNRLCLSLNIHGWQRLRLIELKALRQPLAQALAFASVLSVGDFGVLALFGNANFRTMPFYLHQQMGSYRNHDGAVTALLLLLLCFLLFTLIERLPSPSYQ
ncbi:Thiamine transport system permease protein ThiP [Serratia symbiotica]|nr:Thiamine transport system permease protein ThiP [Serratia symbiotica]